MECFLAGVRPAGAEPETVWSQQAVERFEELTQVCIRYPPCIMQGEKWYSKPKEGDSRGLSKALIIREKQRPLVSPPFGRLV